MTTKTFQPQYSANPSERWVVEINTMEKPNHLSQKYWWNKKLRMDWFEPDFDKYNEHISQLKRYKCPAMPEGWKDKEKVEEGKDFELKNKDVNDCCPECGRQEVVNINLVGNGYRVCKACHQEWWLDVKYTSSFCKIAVPLSSPVPENKKFYAVEYAGFWNIQTVEGYEENDNILDAESVGAENAEKYAKLIAELLNKHYAV